MKVKATNKYQELGVTDKKIGRILKEGEVFEVDEARFKVLSGANGYKNKDGSKVIFAEKVEEIEEAKAPTPKKETAKRKTTKK